MSTARRTREEWRELLGDMDASGLTQQQWCVANGINYNTMREMKSRLAKNENANAGRPIAESNTGWLRLEGTQPGPSKGKASPDSLEIRFGGVTVTMQVSL